MGVTASDIMAGKIVVQLGLASSKDTRGALRELDSAGGLDLISRLAKDGRIDAAGAEAARSRVELYERVWAEAIYLRGVEKHTGMSPAAVARLLAETELDGQRIGEWLVRAGTISEAEDAQLLKKQRRRLEKEGRKIIERYRSDRFKGVARPLVHGSEALDPSAFTVARLFRKPDLQERVARERAKVTERRAAEAASAAAKPAPQAPARSVAPTPPPPPPPPQIASPPSPPTPSPTPAPPVTLTSELEFDFEPAPGPPADLAGVELRELLAAPQPLLPGMARSVLVGVLEDLQRTPQERRGLTSASIRVLPDRSVRVSAASTPPESPTAWDVLRDLVAGHDEALYVAPEVLMGDEADGRSDVYALGVILFEMLTGNPPLRADSARDTGALQLIAPPPTLAEADPDRDWPAGLEQLVAAMLTKDREQRPTAERLLAGRSAFEPAFVDL